VQQTPPDDHVRYAWSAYTLGATLLLWERMHEAKPHLQDAERRFRMGHLEIPTLLCRQALLVAHALGGTWGELSDQKWEAVGTAWHNVHCPLEAARTRIHQALHLHVLVRTKAARSLLEEIQPVIAREGTRYDQAFFCTAMASILADSGELETAIAHLNDAERTFQAGKHTRQVAICCFKRSWAYHRREQFDAAHANLERALALFRRLDLPLHIALCKRSLSSFWCKQQNYHRAHQLALQAQAEASVLGRHDIVADCDLNLGNIAYHTRAYDIALRSYRLAQEIYADLSSTYLLSVSKRNQALVLCAQHQPKAALEVLTTLEADEPIERANIFLDKAGVLIDMQAYDMAMDYLQKAWHGYQQVGKTSAVATCLLAQGWIWLRRSDYAQAQVCFRAAQDDLQDSLGWRVSYGLGRCAYAQGRLSDAREYYWQACARVARLRQEFASPEYSSELFAEAQSLYTDALRLALDFDDAELVVSLIEQQRALVLQRQCASVEMYIPPEVQADYGEQQAYMHTLLSKIRANETTPSLDAAIPYYYRILSNARHSTPKPATLLAKVPDLSELRQHLQANFDRWLVLVYDQWEQDLLTVVLDAHTVTVRCIPLASLTHLLERACQKRWRTHTYGNLAYAYSTNHTPWGVLDELGTHLLPPDVRSRLEPDIRLLIVPCGPLHGVSWSALRVDGQWLCQRAIVHIVPSLSLWSRLVHQPVMGDAALLIGCGTFGARGAPLPHMRDELEHVARLWPGRICRLEEHAATRRTLHELAAQRALQDYRVIHVGTHAQLLASNSMQAHIKLWDDDMFVDEITELFLGGALVVLATCDGAAGEVLPGEEVRSLSYAFLSAGARDVLASIWPLYGALTQPLLHGVYAALARGADAPTALALALRALLAQQDNDSANLACSPLVWGGFVVQGAGTVPSCIAGGTTPACDQVSSATTD